MLMIEAACLSHSFAACVLFAFAGRARRTAKWLPYSMQLPIPSGQSHHSNNMHAILANATRISSEPHNDQMHVPIASLRQGGVPCAWTELLPVVHYLLSTISNRI
jgi:hypothetical protein